MALYQYRCSRHGDFEILVPMGQAPDAMRCEVCGRHARRVYSVPMLRHPQRAVIDAIEQAERSAHEPDVVTSVPSSGQRRPPRLAPRDPRLQRLPRP